MEKNTAPRTSLACSSCRGLKIRCVRPDISRNAQCENCYKSGKECTFVPLEKKRRRKRTDARVSELEHKIRDLSSALNQIGRSSRDVQESSELQGVPAIPWDAALDASLTDFSPSRSLNTDIPDPQARLSSGLVPAAKTNASPDVVGRGVLTWDDALHLFQRYRSDLVTCYPIVPINDVVEMDQIRREKPVLFLAIITAAAAAAPEKLRNALHDEVLSTYATLVLVDGVKSLDLLQAILVTVAWYRPCGSFNDTKYLQYSQAASMMAAELTSESADSTTEGTEYLRTMLAAHIQSATKALLSNVSIVTHDLASFETCIGDFEASIGSDVCDRVLAAHAKLQFLTQEAQQHLCRTRPRGEIRIDDDHVMPILSLYEKQLFAALEGKSKGQSNAFLNITYYASILLLNEVVFYEDYNFRDFRPPYSYDRGPRRYPVAVSPVYVNAIEKCKVSAHKLLDSLFAIDRVILSCAPSVVFVRMMYALFILFKIHLLATSAAHPLSTLLDKQQLNLQGYLLRAQKLCSKLTYSHSFRGADKYLYFITQLEQRYQAWNMGSRVTATTPSGAKNISETSHHPENHPQQWEQQSDQTDLSFWQAESLRSQQIPEMGSLSGERLETFFEDETWRNLPDIDLAMEPLFS